MAEVESPPRGRAEPPGRTRARRRQFEQRMAAAKDTAAQLRAATDYFRGTFTGYSPAEVHQICHLLAELADSERRRLRGPRERDSI